MSKSLLTVDLLNKAGAVVIGSIKNGEWVNGSPDREECARPGFYVLVNPAQYATARFYVGRQRTKSGFYNVMSQIRQGRSQLTRTLANNGVIYDVYFVPVEKMKPLTTGYQKGQLALMFTPKHNYEYQNLEEMNRILNDNFIFSLQKY